MADNQSIASESAMTHEWRERPWVLAALLAVAGLIIHVITDSGGLQKEAFWFGKPCITVRDETEWIETLEGNWNTLTGARSEEIVNAVNKPKPVLSTNNVYGDGNASSHIFKALMEL